MKAGLGWRQWETSPPEAGCGHSESWERLSAGVRPLRHKSAHTGGLHQRKRREGQQKCLCLGAGGSEGRVKLGGVAKGGGRGARGCEGAGQ